MRTVRAAPVSAGAWLAASFAASAHAASPGDPAHAQAAAHGIDAAGLPLIAGLPFAGLLLSIALFPLCAPRVWHHHYGKIAAVWALAFLAPFTVQAGIHAALATVVHAAFDEYLPFIVLLCALYVVAGGIGVRGNLRGTPATNTTLLAIGTVLASVMGTTGAAMLLIRPVLRANDNRRHRAHVVVFFIFLVANAGGALTPLGDPPLFLGFLNGVTFAWTATHLGLPLLVVSLVLLALFFAIDLRFARMPGEYRSAFADPTPDTGAIWIEGKRNIALLVVVSAAVLSSGLWRPGIGFDVLGTRVELQNAVRDIVLVAVAIVSLACTPRGVRERNAFDWMPIVEVAKLFAAIFITIAPVIAMLRAGEHGVFAWLAQSVAKPDGGPDDVMYFWVTGLLSSFLDNAPTYLVFFNIAGGDAQQLMSHGASTLTAISAGAVFMGANTYIGNAPNFMVRSIAQSRGVAMPGFFGYMAWSGAILLPVFAILSVLFFR
ncbi:sodium:proton antiporter [Pararobbsia silviterrae]|uniref:Sodium:proton antiporter n=1 Tax=Pararobbsia silviterrae TaxID=1792498 RepID=A0A494Y5H5_9BURK|nr:sodium:proton antiporter [Pararobbsia silviterrae]RKP56763.1 sodium:proton antiporter [Pararobbsia silviterrae]